MQLDLKPFFSNETEESLPFDYAVDLSDTEWNGIHPFVSPVRIKGAVSACAGAAALTAEVSFDFSMPCDRCAEMALTHRKEVFSHRLLLSEEEGEDDLYIRVTSAELDLDALIREDLLLSLPTRYLCKADCKGLCPVCGQNLNRGSCSCRNETVDPRLEVLKKWIGRE